MHFVRPPRHLAWSPPDDGRALHRRSTSGRLASAARSTAGARRCGRREGPALDDPSTPSGPGVWAGRAAVPEPCVRRCTVARAGRTLCCSAARRGATIRRASFSSSAPTTTRFTIESAWHRASPAIGATRRSITSASPHPRPSRRAHGPVRRPPPGSSNSLIASPTPMPVSATPCAGAMPRAPQRRLRHPPPPRLRCISHSTDPIQHPHQSTARHLPRIDRIHAAPASPTSTSSNGEQRHRRPATTHGSTARRPSTLRPNSCNRPCSGGATARRGADRDARISRR